MDSNYIKKDGFSNPDTERFFQKHWNEDLMDATCSARNPGTAKESPLARDASASAASVPSVTRTSSSRKGALRTATCAVGGMSPVSSSPRTSL